MSSSIKRFYENHHNPTPSLKAVHREPAPSINFEKSSQRRTASTIHIFQSGKRPATSNHIVYEDDEKSPRQIPNPGTQQDHNISTYRWNLLPIWTLDLPVLNANRVINTNEITILFIRYTAPTFASPDSHPVQGQRVGPKHELIIQGARIDNLNDLNSSTFVINFHPGTPCASTPRPRISINPPEHEALILTIMRKYLPEFLKSPSSTTEISEELSDLWFKMQWYLDDPWIYTSHDTPVYLEETVRM